MSEIAESTPFEFDPSRIYRSEGYSMVLEHMRGFRGDPTQEMWRFATQDDDEPDGHGWLEIRVHEVVQTERSGVLAVYYRQWFTPDGEPAWGKSPQRKVGSLGSLKALMRRRKMELQP